MRFLILRVLTHSELGMFHEYRRQGKEGSKQRAINFDWDVVDRVFPAAKDTDRVEMNLRYDSDSGVQIAAQWLKRQEKNWRLEGNCPKDKLYTFVDPGCLFAMEVDASNSPADGAWAVFPKDHPVTAAILADGETSGLAKSAMIALHDQEAAKTWLVLSDARPDLFSAPKIGNSTSATVTIEGPNGIELAPNPARLVDILASVGHTMPSAVADLVDNAISANATEIAITFGRPDSGHGRWMAIADNGDGMNRARLTEAMRIGSETAYEGNSLGKYGYGLKGASWSQTNVFTVVSKCEGGEVQHLSWDKDDMAGWRAKSNPLEPWEQDATKLGSHGTVVLWKDMRPPQVMSTMRGLDPHSTEIKQLSRHLALVFHRFLEGKAEGRKKVTITINGVRVEPNNPFGHELAVPYDMKTIRVPTEDEDGLVHVQAYLLPSEKEVIDHAKDKGIDQARAVELIGLYGKRNDTQGLFIYRNDRLITWGGWHEMWATNDEKTKLARVQVDFDGVLDDAFKINISKQIVRLPPSLQEAIKGLADVARKDSQKKYRKEGKETPPPGATGGTSAGTPSSTGTGSGGAIRGGGSSGPPPSSPPAGPTAGPAGSAIPAPKVNVRDVTTDKFVWKVTTGMTGALEIQVSGVNPTLSALVGEIKANPHAVAHLAAFLRSLDQAGVQDKLLPEKVD